MLKKVKKSLRTNSRKRNINAQANRKTSSAIRYKIRSLKQIAQELENIFKNCYMPANNSKLSILSIDIVYDNVIEQYNMLKTDTCHLKKNVRKHRKDISDIRRESKPIKLRLKSYISMHIIRKDLDKINEKAHAVKCDLHDTKNSLEKHRKEICDNTKDNSLLCHNIYEIRHGLCFVRIEFEKIDSVDKK